MADCFVWVKKFLCVFNHLVEASASICLMLNSYGSYTDALFLRLNDSINSDSGAVCSEQVKTAFTSVSLYVTKKVFHGSNKEKVSKTAETPSEYGVEKESGRKVSKSSRSKKKSYRL